MRIRIIVILAVAVGLTLALGLFIITGGDSTAPDRSVPTEQLAGSSLSPEIAKRGEPQTPTSWLEISIAVLSLATIISVGISFYLYRWRRILLAKPHLIVPEEWGRYLEGVGQALQVLAGTVDKNLGLVTQTTSEHRDQASKLLQTFLTLQVAIDVRDEEIKRLKKGYDSQVYRRFLKRFIRVDQLVGDYLRSQSVQHDSMAQVKRLLEDALDECGVEAFSPSIGDDARVVDGLTDNPKTVSVDDPESEFKIIEVLEQGYKIRNEERDEILVPANVVIGILDK